MRAWILAIGLCATGLLAGCETGPPMTAAECSTADWRYLGYADGSNGRGAGYFGERAQACANAGYGANEQPYRDGYAEGVRVFCQPARGFQIGEAGDTPGVACPIDLAGAFDAAYRDGRDVFRARSAFESAESTIRSLFSERESVERKLVANEVGLQASTTEADIARHRSEVIRLRSELISIDRRIREAEYQARFARDDYDRLRWRLRY